LAQPEDIQQDYTSLPYAVITRLAGRFFPLAISRRCSRTRSCHTQGANRIFEKNAALINLAFSRPGWERIWSAS